MRRGRYAGVSYPKQAMPGKTPGSSPGKDERSSG